MLYEFDRADFVELQKAVRLEGAGSFESVGDPGLRRVARRIFQEADWSRQDETEPWPLRWLTKLDRLFLLNPPDSPGYFFAGGVFRVPNQGPTMPSLSVTGLGVTPLAALSAAVGELAELESIYGPGEHLLRASSHALPERTRSIELEDHGLPPLSDRSRRPAWIPASPISGSPGVVVPADHVFSDPGNETPPHRPVPLSEGCGAGRDIESAIAHGVLELVERDAFCLWWYGGRPPRRIDLASLGSFDFRDFRERIRGGTQMRHDIVLDITTELGIPCVAAVSWDLSGRQIACGTAARLSVAAAVEAAFREMCQLEFGYHIVAQKMRQVGDPGLTDADRAKLSQGELLNAFRLPMLQARGRSADQSHAQRREDAPTQLDLQAKLAQADMEACWVRLSRPDANLHVIKALSPDLQPGTHEVRTPRLRRLLGQTGGTVEFARGAVLM